MKHLSPALFKAVQSSVHGCRQMSGQAVVARHLLSPSGDTGRQPIHRNGRFPWLIDLSLAQEMIAALQQVGMLDEVIEKMGLVVYPAG